MREYYYLVASLPIVEFGMKMPISYSDFLSLCREQLSARDMETVKRASILPSEDTLDPSPALREWKGFDRDLRNELARARASKHAKDAALYIRGEDYRNPFLSGTVQWVLNQDSPLEAESFLDRMRWEKIEELKKGHYFDIDYLIAYSLQLKILERWERIKSADGKGLLEEILEKEMA